MYYAFDEEQRRAELTAIHAAVDRQFRNEQTGNETTGRAAESVDRNGRESSTFERTI